MYRQQKKCRYNSTQCYKIRQILHLIKPFKSYFKGFLGIMIAAIIYAMIPLPPNAQNSTHPKRISVGSILRYSAIPPHTPSNILFTFDLYNRFSIITITSSLLIYYNFRVSTVFAVFAYQEKIHSGNQPIAS